MIEIVPPLRQHMIASRNACGRSVSSIIACFRARLDRPHYDGPVFERGEGSIVWDVEGKAYLDFNSGQICGVLGHSHPRVVEAIARAARTMIHASSTFYNVYEIALSERLALTLPPGLRKSFFGLSGS